MNLQVLVVFPASRCNCRCVMCDIWQAEPNTFLDVDDWRTRRVPELVELGVREVAFSGGEPLLHPRFGELVEPLVAAGISASLVTTGLLLAEKRMDVARGIGAVYVSLDGPRPIHDAIRRVPRAFDRLASGIRALREIAPRIPIGARTVVQRANHRELRATVAAARALGLDRISFLAADLTSEAFARDGGWSAQRQAEIGIGAADLAALEAEVEALLHEERGRDFVAESPSKMWRIVRHFAAWSGAAEPESPPCNAPWVSAVVESDGQVRPCFFHPAYGSWDDRSLGDVLTDRPAERFRDGLQVVSNRVCRRCVCALHLTEGSFQAARASE